MAFAIVDWAEYLKRIYKFTKPGGWVQLVEHDLILHCDDDTLSGASHLQVYMRAISSALEQMGKDPKVSQKLAKYAQDAGFVIVKEEALRTPISNWPKDKQFKELGKWILAASETGREAHAIALLTRGKDKMSKDEVKALVDGVKKEQVTKSVHAYQYQ